MGSNQDPTTPAPGGLTGVAQRIREQLERLAAVPGGSFIVLRAFLGFTFTFAGIQKLTDRYFFQASTPGSIKQQLLASTRTAAAPVHFLVSGAAHAPVLVGLLIAFGEIAVGLGTLVGLFSRVAAFGGALLSLSFFLTVTFHASPYYYGPDIVFFFAWTGLVINGAGVWSLDAMLVERTLQERIALRTDRARQSAAARRRAAEVDRRAALRKAFAAGVLGAVAVVLGGLGAVLGRLIAPAHPPQGSGPSLAGSTAQPSTGTTPSGGATTPSGTGSGARSVKLGKASVVPVGGAASFTDPKQGVPAYVVQPTKGQFVAFSAVCTHAGCTVQFDPQNKDFVCPCHGSVYAGATGEVLNGPSMTPLPKIPISEAADGQLYVDG
jgi:thiosulfate dehydrogenase [quinone] large subunit